MTRLREMREKKGVKAVAIANYLGVTRQTYSIYEDNPERMSVAQAKAVCDFLGCSVNDIFFDQEVNLTNH